MLIGYARISTPEQNFDLQEDALLDAGCEKIFRDTVSGVRSHRKGLEAMLSDLRKGDVVVVWKLDRLGRSLSHLIQLINELASKDVGLRSLNDPIDTTTPQGRLITNVFASIAEFERELISERTQAGLKAARARGRQGGRKKGLSQEAENTAMAAETLYKKGSMTAMAIAKRLGISKSTLYKYLRHRGVEIGPYSKTQGGHYASE